MKKLVIIATAILFMAGYTANAQMGHDNQNKQNQGMMMQKSGMMQGNMMQGMMNKGMCPMCGQKMNQNMPMKKYAMLVNQLPSMQSQLSLNDDQVEELIDLQTEFKKEQIDYKAELRKKQMKMKSMLEENASVKQVKNQMETCSETKINMKTAAYETAGKMKDVLTSDQKQKLNDAMMQGGMMQGGMMQNRGGMINQGQGGMMNQGQGGMMQNQNNQ